MWARTRLTSLGESFSLRIFISWSMLSISSKLIAIHLRRWRRWYSRTRSSSAWPLSTADSSADNLCSTSFFCLYLFHRKALPMNLKIQTSSKEGYNNVCLCRCPGSMYANSYLGNRVYGLGLDSKIQSQSPDNKARKSLGISWSQQDLSLSFRMRCSSHPAISILTLLDIQCHRVLPVSPPLRRWIFKESQNLRGHCLPATDAGLLMKLLKSWSSFFFHAIPSWGTLTHLYQILRINYLGWKWSPFSRMHSGTSSIIHLSIISRAWQAFLVLERVYNRQSLLSGSFHSSGGRQIKRNRWQGGWGHTLRSRKKRGEWVRRWCGSSTHKVSRSDPSEEMAGAKPRQEGRERSPDPEEYSESEKQMRKEEWLEETESRERKWDTNTTLGGQQYRRWEMDARKYKTGNICWCVATHKSQVKRPWFPREVYQIPLPEPPASLPEQEALLWEYLDKVLASSRWRVKGEGGGPPTPQSLYRTLCRRILPVPSSAYMPSSSSLIPPPPCSPFPAYLDKTRFDPKVKDHCTVDTVIKTFRLFFDPTRKHLACYSITICSLLGKTIQRPIPSSGILLLLLLENGCLVPQTAPPPPPWRCLCHRKTTYKGPRVYLLHDEFWVSLVVL